MREEPRQRKSHRILKTAGWMFLAAIIGGWLAALAYQKAINLGFTEWAANKLPYGGMLAGAALGWAICRAESVKRFLGSLGLILVTGCVFWFFGLVGEGVLIAFGMPQKIATWLSPAGFCFGILLAGFALSVEMYEKIRGFIIRDESASSHGVEKGD